MYLAFDPGETLGYAKWLDNGQLVEAGQANQEELHELLERIAPDPTEVKHVIIEDYVLWAKLARQQAGSKMPAAQGKGMLKFWCKQNDIPFTMQKSDILPTAQKISQQRIPSRHSISHQFVAYNHGFFWLHKNGIVKSPLQIEMEEKKNA